MNVPELNSKNVAKIVLLIVFVSAIKKFVEIYRVKHELISPLIPEGTISEITEPLFYNGILTTVVGIVGMLFFFYRKYTVVIILGILIILWLLYIYPYFYF